MFKIQIAVLFSLVGLAQASEAQDVYCGPYSGTTWPGTILSSQAGINSFPASCTVHRGDLIIGTRLRSCNSYITNLGALSNLRRVTGSLRFQCLRSLENLRGLESLERVDKAMTLWRNYKLQSLDGLNSLISTGDTISIKEQFRLENVDGLSSLTSIGASLKILDNWVLTNVDGLSNVTEIDGALVITGNSTLGDCSGLQPVLKDGYVASTVTIDGNAVGCNSVEEVNPLPEPPPPEPPPPESDPIDPAVWWIIHNKNVTYEESEG